MPIQDHPCHIPIEENATLWRYMSLAKYKSLLESQSLFFCRADKFPPLGVASRYVLFNKASGLDIFFCGKMPV